MNLDIRVVFRYLGLLLFVLSALILAMAIFAAGDRLIGEAGGHADLRAFLITALVGAVVGGALFLGGRRTGDLLGEREALLLVAVSWLVGAALGALPFRLWAMFRVDAALSPHGLDSYINCYFEAMSGFTTTGATILEAIGTVPRSLLLWRALTHWLGGLGIVVLFVAVLPMLGVGGRRVYRIEAPGPAPEGVRPRIQDTARILWTIYVGLTIVEIIALMICGMDWFAATCHTFATMATGGFSTLDQSIAGFDLPGVDAIIVVFMVLAGVNFGLYHAVLQGQWRDALRDPELRVYLGIMAVATVIVTVSLLRGTSTAEGLPVGTAISQGLFQVVSIQTTTGFCNADFDTWDFTAKATLLVLMFVGGCAGSTGGGIKVMRMVIAAKVLLAELERAYRPKVVRSVKVGRSTIDPELKLDVLVFVVGIGLVFALGTVALMMSESGQDIDITTAATASAATLNNVGPGLARVGATRNYAWFSDAGKMILSVLMVVGRLEMFTIIVLVSPKFWRSE